MNKKTTIAISRENFQKLKLRQKWKESMDDIITSLLQEKGEQNAKNQGQAQ